MKSGAQLGVYKNWSTTIQVEQYMLSTIIKIINVLTIK